MTRNQKSSAVIALLSLGLAGCVTMPTGPSRMALPGTGKDFDTFRADDASCREYGLQVSGAKPGDAQADSAVKSAAVGTVIGATAGAAIGNSAQGAAAGAGVGLMMGALAGAGAGAQSGYAVQRRYDNGYTQCMYAKGHRVPVAGNMAQQQRPAPQAQSYPAPPAPQAPQAQAQPPQQPLLQPQVQFYPPPPPGSGPPPPSAIVR
jgi:outer membrane lipoprotein SlyB